MSELFTPVYTRHVGARLHMWKGTISGGSVTSSYGGKFFSAVTSPATGRALFTYASTKKRAGVVICEGEGAATAIGIENISVIPTTTQFEITRRTNALTAADGLIGLVGIAYDWDLTEVQPRTPLTSAHPGTRIIFGQVSSAGAAKIGMGAFTCSKTATGAYTVIFRKDFQLAPIVKINIDSATFFKKDSLVVTNTGFTIGIEDSGGSAADAQFSFMAVGTDVAHDNSDHYSIVTSNLSECTLVPTSFDSSRVNVVNPSVLTVADTGTGTASANITNIDAPEGVTNSATDNQYMLFGTGSPGHVSFTQGAMATPGAANTIKTYTAGGTTAADTAFAAFLVSPRQTVSVS